MWGRFELGEGGVVNKDYIGKVYLSRVFFCCFLSSIIFVLFEF